VRPVLLTGATGFVGGRLLRLLEQEGLPVRAGSRRPDRLAARVTSTTEAVRLDVGDASSLAPALAGCGAAYYLVHSLEQTGDFAAEELHGAERFARAAERAGLERVVYLGGIVPEGEELSEHLRSRVEVGEALRGGGVPTLELRASIVLGEGSLSWEAIRSVVELGPVVPLPDWVKTMSQPIAADDLLAYLRAALDVPLPASRVVEVGGADRVPYLDVLEEAARQLGLERSFPTAPVPAPVLPSSLVPEWAAGLAPERVRATVKLVESLRHETVVRDGAAAELFPEVRPLGLADAVERALA
jgi:uncharacterized protein YbjT (DUF2867 family)